MPPRISLGLAVALCTAKRIPVTTRSKKGLTVYVEDMDLEDAKATLAEVKASPCRDCEQCRWDIEDLEGRIRELS
jgi:hypothetical protein